MPDLNVMTWNSTGESPAKATYLHGLIVNNPVVRNWMPDVIVIQEAQAAIGGAIWNMFIDMGTPGNPQFNANYNGVAPQFVGIQGEGYILMHSVNVALGAGGFAVLNLAMDQGVINAIQGFAPQQRNALNQAVASYRSPATAQLVFAGRNVELMTWHAELGPGLNFMLGMNRDVNYAAYFFLQNSDYYTNTLTQPGGANNNLGLISADLNARPADIGNNTNCPQVPHLLPNWTAASNNLDHIAARRNNGAGGITFNNSGHYNNAHSVHDVLVATVHWP